MQTSANIENVRSPLHDNAFRTIVACTNRHLSEAGYTNSNNNYVEAAIASAATSGRAWARKRQNESAGLGKLFRSQSPAALNAFFQCFNPQVRRFRMCGEILDVMASHGAEHPALICPEPGDEYSWARQIVAGYQEWCTRRNIRPVMEVVSSFPTNGGLEASLADALSRGDVDSLLFGWQDVAQRAEAALTRIGQRPGKVQLASLLNAQDTLNDSYVAGLDLQPCEFGQKTAAVLCESISTPTLSPVHQVHQALVVLPADGGITARMF